MTMALWCKVIVLVGLALLHPETAIVFSATAPAMEQPESVPAEEYPFYDLAVEAKFLTSRTRLVIIERMTAIRLHPEEPQLPTVAWFAEQGLFDGRLPQDLIRDFVAKVQRPARLDARFTFGVRYRFVSGEGVPETEAAVPVVPAAWPIEEDGDEDALETLDRLAFSRVGLTLRGDQALLYVANQRPNATGAGFLFWFVRRQGSWEIYDTDVLWVAQPDQNPSGRR
ncbi:MAG TPA: hypothetical protein PLT27_02060 [Nitrospira sp.]|nr:hypothetical protein [Nitrospira sp.]